MVVDFMHECEKNNDYDNQRYQDDVQILNINFVDRKQPSKLYHLKDLLHILAPKVRPSFGQLSRNYLSQAFHALHQLHLKNTHKSNTS